MKYYRDTWVEVDLESIYHNVNNIKKLYAKNKDLIAVVKADGYGHGAIQVAKIALEAGATLLAVSTLDEAIELRKGGIKAPILVLIGIRIKDLKLARKYNIIITVHNIKWLESANKEYKGRTINVQLKIDTGMYRIGLGNKEELIKALELVNNSKCFKLSGIYTHLATSEEDDKSYYLMQDEMFRDLIDGIDTRGLMIHIANSAATIKYENKYTNAVRVGIMLYGLSPNNNINLSFDLKQAISLYTKLNHVKYLSKGKKVSYNGIYETSTGEWIGTVPIGYGDGWDRRMNNGLAYIDGNYCNIIGRICMGQTMIKLPCKMSEGTVVELIGPNIHVNDVAKRINTINYQTVCMLTDRLPRIYKREGKIVDTINRRIK